MEWRAEGESHGPHPRAAKIIKLEVVRSRSSESFFAYALLGLVASGYFALAGSGALDRPTLILTFLALLARFAIVAGFLPVTITDRHIFFAGLAYTAFYPLDFYFISADFLAATMHGVCFLAAVKVLTAKSRRDYLYTGAISFVELFAAALLSSGPSFFAFLTLYLIFTVAALTSAEIRTGSRGLSGRLTRLTLIATAFILTLTAGLFLIVPRTARMAANLFPPNTRLTGFSTSVDLGGFGAIARDNRAVMHVLSYTRPLPAGIKWRGTSLSRFDGRRWFEPQMPGRVIPAIPGPAVIAGLLQRSRRDGQRLLYRVDIQNADTGTLFIAGIPEFVNLDAFQNADPGILQTPSENLRVLVPARDSLRYEVSAHNAQPLATPLTRMERSRYLQLPVLDQRIPKLANEWAATGSPAEQAARIEQRLRSGFHYKLDGPPSPVADPLADFLFVRREGYCEYFASSLAVMLRSLGTPARVVTGFQSGYFNNVSGLQVVRASDAHAWVEAWFEDRGWVTFDPTPAAPLAASAGLLARLNMYLDAADNTWQEWVVSYDLGHQIALAGNFENALRSRKFSWPELSRFKKTWAAWLGAAALLLYFGPRFYRSRKRARTLSPATEAGALYAKLLKVLARRGHQKPAGTTPGEFAVSLPPSEAAGVAQFTSLYNSVRFGGDAASLPALARMLREIDRN